MALILIADDDEIIVEIVREALGARGHIVGAVDDGRQVVSIVASKRPALVILDCNMPEVSGLTALQELRRSATYFTLPVLMLTGRRSEGDEAIALRMGANDYMRKPFDADLLVDRVEALLDSAAALERRSEVRPRVTAPSERRWGQR